MTYMFISLASVVYQYTGCDISHIRIFLSGHLSHIQPPNIPGLLRTGKFMVAQMYVSWRYIAYSINMYEVRLFYCYALAGSFSVASISMNSLSTLLNDGTLYIEQFISFTDLWVIKCIDAYYFTRLSAAMYLIFQSNDGNYLWYLNYGKWYIMCVSSKQLKKPYCHVDYH